jgi:CDP-diacylglycerol--serine O-phosphatidyltransferase
MFSKVSYPSFKALDWRTRRPLRQVVLLIILLGVALLNYTYSLALLFTGYLLYGFLRPYLSRQWRPGPDIEEETEDETPTPP